MFIKNKKLLILSIFLIAIVAISAGSAFAADIQDDMDSPVLADGDIISDGQLGDDPSDPGTNTGGDDPTDPGTNPGGDDPTDPGEGGETTKKETSLTVTADSVTVGDDATFNFDLKDSEGAAIAGDVNLNINSQDYPIATNDEGLGSQVISGLAVGKYNYVATFAETEEYAACEATGIFEVLAKESALTLTVNDITLGNDATIGISLKDKDGNGLDGVVALTVNGKTYNVNVAGGQGSQTISDLGIKSYPVSAKFAGDDTYKAASASATFKVTPTYVSTFAELQNALKNEKVKQIQLTKDIVMTSTITINRNNAIIIDGNGKAVNGQKKVGLFKIYSTVTMKNLILKGGKNGGLGGAIDLHGKLTADNCQFINNTGTGSAATSAAGGAIFAREGSTLSVSNSKFTTNVATVGKGGAVAVFSNNAKFNKCTFTSNKASNGEGGAIASYGKGLNITSCTFKSNSAAAKAKSYAGAITLMGQNPIIQSSTFTSNSAKNHAGAILVGAKVSGTKINKCTFTSNKVTAEDGGAMSWAGGKGSITNCKFTSNYAKQDGGCIDFFNTNGKAAPTITIKNCVFNKNKSTKSAAALFLGVKAKYSISNCNFTSNSKPKYGGAVFFEGASASFSNCNFKSNVASQNGGAISANSGGKMSLTKCTFTSNKAYFGGAILNKAKGITVNSCKFTKNTAGRSGGAIAIQGGANVMKVSTFLSNKAVFGAGIFQGSGSSTITKNTFTSNVASKAGGAGFIAGGKFKQSGNKFKKNKGGKKPNIHKK